MNEALKYRHEYKYIISDAEAAMLRARMSTVLMPDRHTGPTGSYSISSLYFDDMYNSCYYENENGTDPREKLRIRLYNHSTARISLECKEKNRGKTLKASCPVSEEDVRMILDGTISCDNSMPFLEKKLLAGMLQRQLRPVVIVDYDRTPFVYPLGNVRVTLDQNIASSVCVGDFLSGDFPKRPVLPAGQQLLEVKFDDFLPDIIYNSLMLDSLRQTAFSKYYLCRKISL